MRTIRRFAASLLVLSAAAGVASAQEKVTLKPNLQTGQVWNMTQAMDTNMDIKVDAGGQKQTINQKINMAMTATMTIVEAKDGQPVKSKIKFGDDAKISMEMMGQKQNVPFPLAGKEMTVTKKADGTVDIDPPGAVDASAKDMLGQMTEASAAFYPTMPVGAGDKWEVAGDKVTKMFQLEAGGQAKLECTLVDIKEVAGRKVANVTLKGNAAGKMQGAMDVTLDMSGPLTFDVESGQVVSQDIKANMTLKGDQGGAKMDGTGAINVKQTITPAK